MYKNYIKIAWRVLKKSRMYSALNITGLTLGITGFLMILFYIQDEVSYDRFYGNSEEVYRITSHWGLESDAQYATAPPPLGYHLKSEIPEISAATRVVKWNDFTIQPETGPNANQIFREEAVYYAEPDFFEVFDLKILAGSASALSTGKGVVLTQSLAEKYFGDFSVQEVVGKNLLIGSSSPGLSKIGAVVEDIPSQSHFRFDMLVYEPQMHREIFLNEDWTWPILHTYVKISGGNVEAVEDKLKGVVERELLSRLSGDLKAKDFSLGLQKVRDIHLDSHFLREHHANSYRSYIYIFSVVAIIILLLASINFMNLSTAKAVTRSMEVGVRKVLGSKKSQLISQFLTEAFILVLISTFFSLVLLKLLNGLFNQVSGKSISFNIFEPSWLWAVVPLLILVLTVMSGFYPAFYLSSFRPLKVIKSQQSMGKNTISLRSGLVVFQFSISLILIIYALVVHGQLNFIQKCDVGFEKEQLLIIHNDGEIQNHQREDFKGRLSASTNLSSLSFSTGIPIPGQFHMRSFSLPNNTLDKGMNWYEADADYVPTMKLEIVVGRNFMEVEDADKRKVLINEKAAQTLGIFENPIGQQILKNKGYQDEAVLEVVGMVRDFNFESLRQEIRPLVIEYMDDYYLRDYISVRLEPGDFESGIRELQGVWKQFEPRVPMNFSFMDEDFQSVYQSEMQMGTLVGMLTFLSICIACLGLFGLTAYSLQQRGKEIGIRKVFGANMMEIFMLLSGSYIKLIGLSCLIAMPISYYIVGEWLNNFVYKIPVETGVFVLAAFSCFLLALLTVMLQSIKSIRINPVNILKNE